jgi:aminoglycoside phosphotransferase (APT) family kinase protein
MDAFTGTARGRQPCLRCRRAEAYLLKHLPGFDGPLSVEQFKGGQSNPTYKLLTPGAPT